jgi:hypothetical protein
MPLEDELICVLRKPGSLTFLLGTPRSIANLREQLANEGTSIEVGSKLGFKPVSEGGIPEWLRGLECIGVLDGDERAAIELRSRFLTDAQRDRSESLPVPEDRPPPREIPWLYDTPTFRAWLAEDTRPYRGECARLMKIKAPPRQPEPARQPSVVNMAARLESRRTRADANVR